LEKIVYKQLLRINRGFDDVIRSLAVLKRCEGFHAAELRRFRALAQHARASTNSYLAAVIESAETDEAGRLFRRQLARERRDEQGHG
jgi:hypothetical protein